MNTNVFPSMREERALNIGVRKGSPVCSKGRTSDHLFLRHISSSFKLLDDSWFCFLTNHSLSFQLPYILIHVLTKAAIGA